MLPDMTSASQQQSEINCFVPASPYTLPDSVSPVSPRTALLLYTYSPNDTVVRKTGVLAMIARNPPPVELVLVLQYNMIHLMDIGSSTHLSCTLCTNIDK